MFPRTVVEPGVVVSLRLILLCSLLCSGTISGYRRQARARTRIQTERILKQDDDAAQGKHYHEANDGPHHELAAGLALLIARRALNEIGVDAPEEGDKRECEHQRHEHAVDELRDALNESFYGHIRMVASELSGRVLLCTARQKVE